MNTKRKIRLLMAKPGLDGHERGAKVMAYGLRDYGFEVIYTGLRQTPDSIVNAAVQEDVDVIGLSILSGAHLSLTQKIIDKLKVKGAGDTMIIVGGVIPKNDIEKLKNIGVAGVFTAGSSIKEAGDFITSYLESI